MNAADISRRELLLALAACTQLPAAPVAELCFLSATAQARLIRTGKLSARELLAAHLKQIERVNPKVNAIVTLVASQAEKAALAADELQAKRGTLGPLHGLPIAHKDLVDTKGIRTTYGSPLFKDFVPEVDALLVERIRHAGAVLLGKTNTPEFGAGSHTFNPVFGATRNPYDTTKSCGGSSGVARWSPAPPSHARAHATSTTPELMCIHFIGSTLRRAAGFAPSARVARSAVPCGYRSRFGSDGVSSCAGIGRAWSSGWRYDAMGGELWDCRMVLSTSFRLFLNSRIPLPNDALISGTRFAPKSTSTITSITINSPKPRLPNTGPTPRGTTESNSHA